MLLSSYLELAVRYIVLLHWHKETIAVSRDNIIFFVILLFEKNIQVQTKLHIVYIGMLQVTKSYIGFYLIYIYVYIYI